MVFEYHLTYTHIFITYSSLHHHHNESLVYVLHNVNIIIHNCYDYKH